MKINVLTRKIHYWGAIAISVPALIVIATGILLQLKKDWTWVQPEGKTGIGKTPAISFDDVLKSCQSVPEAEIKDWNDIDRIDVRPADGMLKVLAKNRWEIQLDNETSEVLQVAYRRSDLIESIHDGSWFHDLAKLWIFLPTAIVLFVLWLTGMYLFWLPLVVKWRRKRKKLAPVSEMK